MGRYLIFALPLLAGCGATLPDVDPRAEYAEAVRIQQLRPVYPPRQNFRVGSVYYFEDSQDKNRPGTYLGYLPSVERYAIDRASAEIPGHYDRDKLAEAGKDTAFADVAAVSPYMMPSITVSAATATAFGASSLTGAGLLNFGNAKKVSLGFKDPRRFGPSNQERPPRDLYWNDLSLLIQQPGGFCASYPPTLVEGPGGVSIAQRELPWLRVVTAVILSNGIDFFSRNSRASGLAVGVGAPPGSTAPGVTLNVTVPENATPAEVQGLLEGVSAQKAETAFAVSNSSGSEIAFSSKDFGIHVAIAYEAFDVSPDDLALICSSGAI